MFLNCSTCFERHTAHHQELKKCNCSLWFYICLWLPAGRCHGWVGTQFPLSHDSCLQPQTYVKPKAAITVFEFLIMSGVSFETSWAIKKHKNNKFCYKVASCWWFPHDFYYGGRIHEHQVWQTVVTTVMEILVKKAEFCAVLERWRAYQEWY